MPTGKARIEIRPAAANGYDSVPKSLRPHYFAVLAKNDSVLVESPPYATKASARRAVRSLLDALRDVLHIGSHGSTWPPEPPRVIERED